MIAGWVVGYLTAVSMPIEVVALGGVALALVGHALFVNGPVDDLEDLTDEVDADLAEGIASVEGNSRRYEPIVSLERGAIGFDPDPRRASIPSQPGIAKVGETVIIADNEPIERAL